MTKKTINRMVWGTVILFAVIPFVFLGYINNHANQSGMDFSGYLTAEPLMTIQLISVFLLPISAYLLKSRWEQVSEENGPNALYLSVILLMFSQFVIGNVIYGLLLTVLLVFVTRHYHIRIGQAFTSFNDIQSFIRAFAGEIMIIALSVFLQVLASRLR